MSYGLCVIRSSGSGFRLAGDGDFAGPCDIRVLQRRFQQIHRTYYKTIRIYY
jgi:hypothetical protein